MSTYQVPIPSTRAGIACTACGRACLATACDPHRATRHSTPLCDRCAHLDLAELQPLLAARTDQLLEQAALLEREAAQLLA